MCLCWVLQTKVQKQACHLCISIISHENVIHVILGCYGWLTQGSSNIAYVLSLKCNARRDISEYDRNKDLNPAQCTILKSALIIDTLEEMEDKPQLFPHICKIDDTCNDTNWKVRVRVSVWTWYHIMLMSTLILCIVPTTWINRNI